MSYRLDPAMPMSEALRRVAFAELEIAHNALHTPPERHSGVHSARKCLKRLRSLLLLVRPGMPEPAFATLTERLAGIARGLAAARDAAALIDTIDKLEKETGPGPGLGPLQSLRAWLHKRRHAAEQNLEKSAASDAMRGLLELRPSFAGLAVYPDDADGRWPLETRYPGKMPVETDEGEGRPSRWNTLRALRVLDWYSRG